MKFGDLFKALGRWIGARAKEKSTWLGAATLAASVATTVGHPEIAALIKVGLAAVGGGLVAATTTPALPADASAVGTGAAG
jgi:hypothetical protein